MCTRSSSMARWPGGSSSDDLADVRRIHRHPAVPGEVDLRAAMLRLRRVADERPRLRKPRSDRRDAEAVDVARRNPRGAAEPDEQRVQVRAFAAQVSRLEHEADVADAAALRLGSRNVLSTIQS